MTTRREFITDATKAAIATGLITFAGNSNTDMTIENKFIHHVYFWLKNTGNIADRDALISGLRKLSKVSTIREFHIGLPAGTSRDVIDTSYSVSWMLKFDTPEDQDSYQVDPIHLQFVKECSPLWSKVVVYDSIDV